MEEMIIVNGVKVSLREYRKEIAARNAAKNPTKQVEKKKKSGRYTIRLAADDIQRIVKKVTLIKSLNSYYDNGYRQWGNICKRILSLKEINTPFVAFRVKVRELDKIMANIQDVSKRNSKDVYDYIRRLSYILEDISECINNLSGSVSKCDLINLHHKHECISGNGKRLGLKVLISRTYSTTEELKRIVKDLKELADNGI